jgi:hypothetical protein
MGMLDHMGDEGISEGQEQRRVYPPHEVQSRLAVSASGLRRLAGIYERTMGPLPRDERGRMWPEDAVEALEDARTLVRESRGISIEAALRGQEVRGAARTLSGYSEALTRGYRPRSGHTPGVTGTARSSE